MILAIRKKIIVLLAMSLMFMTYGLPSGLHLGLCIGEDGHWDITVVACAPDQQGPFSKHSKENPTDHHGKCTDFTTTCDEKEIHRPTSLLMPPNPSSKAIPIMSVASASALGLPPALKPSAFSPCSSETSYPLAAYPRSVVLLI